MKTEVINSSGYKMVKMPDHPKASSWDFVVEHLVVWEEAHNKSLPADMIIVHLNGDKLDNSPDNLHAMSRSDFKKWSSFVPILQKRIRELEKLLEK
jgi:hypothetical protein